MTRSAPRIEEIYFAALERESGPARAAFLDEACGGVPELRARIDRMLRAQPEVSRFLEAPAPEIAATVVAPDATAVGTRIGPYKLLEQIGEGGMGVVYVAEQTEPIRRRVALKVIKPGMDSRQVVARFAAERQALALMDHPHIATVLDAGVNEAGLPYFVMELVRGLPITEYCDAAKLTPDQRIELFIAVCQAVQHAHQKGIIHRDLKPSNVLVTQLDGKPIPKVIDFGVAKAIGPQLSDRSVYTGFMQLVGTPLYMSPEQAELSAADIDTRSDVYSLGVLLYELLTGRTPFDSETLFSKGLDEMRRIIREQEPPRPSHRVSTLQAADVSTVSSRRSLDERRLQQQLTGELDWIVMKALEKDRDRRYESASAMAADLRRYLADEPVLACPPSVGYRLRKTVRRHRALLTTAGLLTATLLIATGVSVWQALIANAAKTEALRSNAIARQAVEDMYSGFAEKWLSEKGAASAVQKEFLEKAIAFYESQQQLPGDSTTDLLRNLTDRLRVAAIQRKLGNQREAESGFVAVIEQSNDPRSTGPTGAAIQILGVSARSQLGRLLASLRRKPDAVAQYESAFARVQALAARTDLTNVDRAELASIAAKLGMQLETNRKRAEGELSMTISLNLWKQLLQSDPTNWDYRSGYALALGEQGIQLIWNGRRLEKAREAFTASNTLLSEVLKDKPRDYRCRYRLGVNYHNLGLLSSSKRDDNGAVALYQSAVRIYEDVIRDFPDDQDTLYGLAFTLNTLTDIFTSLGKAEERDRAFHRSQEACERLTQLFPSVIDYAVLRNRSCTEELFRHVKQGDLGAAVTIAEQLCDYFEMAKPRFQQEELLEVETMENWALLRKAGCLLDLQKPGEAKAALDRLNTGLFHFDVSKMQVEWDRNTATEDRFRIAIAYYDQFAVRIYLLTHIRECLRRLNEPQSGTAEHESQLPSPLSHMADVLERESNRVWEDFERRFPDLKLTAQGLYYAYLDCSSEGRDARELSKVDRLASRAARLPFARKLIEAVDQIGPAADQGSLSYIIMELVAGDEGLRDAKLACRLAERGLERNPKDGMARQDMAYALFRGGKFEESMKMLGDKCQVGDPTISALVAMNLWHLDRKAEGIEYLLSEYRAKLDRYCADNERIQQGKLTVIWPTAGQLRRLDREAVELYRKEARFQDRLASTAPPSQ